jgi:hypothetical protein
VGGLRECCRLFDMDARLTAGQSRDILSLVQHCMPEVGVDAPEQLEYAAQRPTHRRRFIGVGHSIGGNTMQVQFLHPFRLY